MGEVSRKGTSVCNLQTEVPFLSFYVAAKPPAVKKRTPLSRRKNHCFLRNDRFIRMRTVFVDLFFNRLFREIRLEVSIFDLNLYFSLTPI